MNNRHGMLFCVVALVYILRGTSAQFQPGLEIVGGHGLNGIIADDARQGASLTLHAFTQAGEPLNFYIHSCFALGNGQPPLSLVDVSGCVVNNPSLVHAPVYTYRPSVLGPYHEFIYMYAPPIGRQPGLQVVYRYECKIKVCPSGCLPPNLSCQSTYSSAQFPKRAKRSQGYDTGSSSQADTNPFSLNPINIGNGHQKQVPSGYQEPYETTVTTASIRIHNVQSPGGVTPYQPGYYQDDGNDVWTWWAILLLVLGILMCLILLAVCLAFCCIRCRRNKQIVSPGQKKQKQSTILHLDPAYHTPISRPTSYATQTSDVYATSAVNMMTAPSGGNTEVYQQLGQQPIAIVSKSRMV